MPASRTGLSPEWARRPDEVFAELLSHDDDLVRAEFECLTRSSGVDADRTPPRAVPQPRAGGERAGWPPGLTRL
ncbi:hypothetical protein [Dactylosporangium sp. CA-139066]|uniref:hypothetical protein n=1 Tax=Dactylosporangium sp. CA-139066 TaxID=3239930 RepID=UPI003D901A5C